MKTVLLANWILIAVYGTGLLLSTLLLNQPGSDPAGRGMAAGALLFGALLLAGAAGLNLLPHRGTRILTLVLLALPLALGAARGVEALLTSHRERNEDQARADGTYYFDDARRELAAAIVQNDAAKLQALLKQPLPTLNESGTEHVTLLDFATLRAAGSDHPERAFPCLERLLEHGATVETADTLRVQSHALVPWQSSASLLAFFLKRGANPNAKTPDGASLLMSALIHERDRREKLTLLLDHGADPNAASLVSVGTPDYTPLLYAAHLSLWDECLLLLERGADPTYQTPGGENLRKIITEREPSPGEASSPTFLKLKEKAMGGALKN